MRLNNLVDKLDGIVFSGGGDISPDNFKENEDENLYGIDKERDSMELAKRGRSDDQIASGRGKIPVKTRPIVASWVPSDRYSPTDVALLWAWK